MKTTATILLILSIIALATAVCSFGESEACEAAFRVCSKAASEESCGW